MAVNYFGKRRLEKIFFNYISDRKELTKTVKKDLKELGKEFVFHYRKNRGSEWFKVSAYDEYNSIAVYFELYTDTSDKGCHISMSEWHSEDDELENKRQVFYGHAYYTEDFCPHSGETKLQCFEIRKTSERGYK